MILPMQNGTDMVTADDINNKHTAPEINAVFRNITKILILKH